MDGVPLALGRHGAHQTGLKRNYMRSKPLSWMATLLAFAAGATMALAAEKTLKVGDPAPKLQTGKWVQGDAVKDFEKGKAYVVEFWATWCGPCRVSIPHLNETYTKYKDKGLVVIGQDCWEKDDGLVAPFIEKMGEKMTYRVALDDKSHEEKGQMAKTWMEAAGQNGIPSAFLVDTKGVIAWIGHPMSLKDQIIDEVLAGKFDIEKAAAESAEAEKNQAKMQGVFTALSRAMRNKDWDAADEKLGEAEKLMPEDQRQGLDMTRFNILIGKEDYPGAYKLAGKISDANKDNPMLQNELAWKIATDKSIKKRDLNLAEKMANRANDATKGKDAAILDTLARVMFMQGKKDQAIALQEKAVNLVDGNDKDTFQDTLDAYKKGELSKAD